MTPNPQRVAKQQGSASADALRAYWIRPTITLWQTDGGWHFADSAQRVVSRARLLAWQRRGWIARDSICKETGRAVWSLTDDGARVVNSRA